MNGFKDFDVALKARDVLRKLVRSEFRKSGAMPTYGTVLDIDRPGSRAQVQINGQTGAVWITTNVVAPGAVGQTVRILGPDGDQYIDSVVSGTPYIEATVPVTNSVSATTLGSVVAKIEVFDDNGTSLGFLPVYDSIT